jgi:hypothetical protein
MPATAARIGFVTQEWRRSVASDPAVKTLYGEAARDTAGKDGEPVETFFDEPADALTMATQRLSLLKANRRRFKQDVNEVLEFTGSLDFSQVTPAVRVVDTDLDEGANKTVIVSWG